MRAIDDLLYLLRGRVDRDGDDDEILTRRLERVEPGERRTARRALRRPHFDDDGLAGE
jgi:hypothetical protein